jgi:hypothetical protein
MAALPQNSTPLNQQARRWLQSAKQPAEPHYLHVLSLAFWGVEQKVEGEWPDCDRPAVEQQVGLLLSWKPANVLPWLSSNPNGPDNRVEQLQNLTRSLREASSPQQAAALVLSAIYDRQVAENPALQSAASELS